LGRNVYAKNASVGGRVAQPTVYDSNTQNVVPVAKDVEGGPTESSSSDNDMTPPLCAVLICGYRMLICSHVYDMLSWCKQSICFADIRPGDESLRRRSNPKVQV
jgi:hypothetical protein